MTMLVVAAALIDPEGRVLLARRPVDKQYGGLWEFPGGKVEAGETPAVALARELGEELGIDVDPALLTPIAFSESPGEHHVVLLLYRCRSWHGDARALDATEIRWVGLGDLAQFAMPPADQPLAEILAAER